jgi:ATP-binding cassette subfamily C protein CydD
MADSKAATRLWTREQTRLGQARAIPVIAHGTVGTLAAIGQAGCLAQVLAHALSGALPTAQPFLIGFAALAVLRAALQFYAEQAAFAAGAAGRSRLRADALKRLLAAGPAMLRQNHSAELTSTLVDNIEALDGFFGRWIPASAMAAMGPLLVGLAALWVDPFAGAILLGAGLLVPVGQAFAGIGAASASNKQFLAMTRLQTRFLDRVRGIATIVLAGRADDEATSLGQAADELRTRTMRVLRVAFLSSAALDCAMAAALVITALHDRHILAGHEGSPFHALYSLLLVPEFFAPLRGFAAAYQDRMHAASAADSLLKLPKLPPTPATTPTIRTIEVRGLAVAFENVGFTWDSTRGPTLQALNFFVPPGGTLVLAGASGSGKSTVIELLLGFIRPESGRILLNGNDIADIVPQALSALTAWIGQKPTLFAGSIADNIAFARPDASRPEIEEAARAALVTEFADRLPRGLDTAIGEGGHGVSGGQAQRVAIARAYLKNAPLLLLDEPTAHLDPATEAEVLASLKRLAVGRTVVIASHSAAAQGFGGKRVDLKAAA